MPEGLRWTGSAGPGDYAYQVVDYTHHGYRRVGRGVFAWRQISTVLPTDVITIGDDVFLHVMACRGLGNPRATELHRSRDSGRTWDPAGARWPGDAPRRALPDADLGARRGRGVGVRR